jgi:outer membrane immunogenic protein
MDKRMLLGSAVLAGMITAGFALAGELDQQQNALPPVGAPAWLNWTGFYAGTHVGAGWATTQWSDFGSVSSPGPWRSLGSSSNFLSGGQIGANWQSGRFVIGIEAGASALDGSGPCIETGCGSKTIGTVTGRVGATVDHTLFYLKGGAAGMQ